MGKYVMTPMPLPPIIPPPTPMPLPPIIPPPPLIPPSTPMPPPPLIPPPSIIPPSTYQWYGVCELVSPYRNSMDIVQVYNFNDYTFSTDESIPEVTSNNKNIPNCSYSLSFKLHRWFVDQDIKYELRIVNSTVEILLSAEIATLVKLTWSGRL
jgi:hypothetical protein